MRSILKKLLILMNLILFFGFLNGENSAESKKKSIIKLFCLENFRNEMLKANIIYDDEIAESTCDCYLNEFLKSASHQEAITRCKLESKEKLNL